MIPNRQARIAAPGVVLLAVVGLFVGHTLEYLRVWGAEGVLASMTNPVHAYMLPVAGVVLLLSAIFAFRLALAWQKLNDRLDRAAASVRRIWRGRAAEAPSSSIRGSTPGTRLVALWLPIAAAQIALYLVQENLEAVARSQPAPGLGAITAVHWAAPLIHLYVALLLACVVRICEILIRRREVVVERVEAMLRSAICRRRHTVAGAGTPVPPQCASPLDQLGRHLWRRPPPRPLGV
ncbi:MAG: hypothetical protein ACHQ4F_14095 [Candidatus Dormibacteria bacterium]